MGPFTDGLQSDAKYEASAVYEHKAYMMPGPSRAQWVERMS
jgi:hypothetical protein